MRHLAANNYIYVTIRLCVAPTDNLYVSPVKYEFTHPVAQCYASRCLSDLGVFIATDKFSVVQSNSSSVLNRVSPHVYSAFINTRLSQYPNPYRVAPFNDTHTPSYTHLHFFSLALPLPLIINKNNKLEKIKKNSVDRL